MLWPQWTKLLAHRDRTLMLVRGLDENSRPVYHYVAVSRLKMPLLEKQAGKGEFSVSDYGEVLVSRYGYRPAESARQEALEAFEKLKTS